MTPSGSQSATADSSAIVVGSSPLMMCVALRLARAGWTVEIHDDRSVPGGAWCATKAFGHSVVEPAVHLLENRAKSYAHLASISGVDLGPDPRVEGLLGTRRLGPHTMRIVMFLGVWLRAMRRLDGPQIRLAGRSLLRSIRNRSVPFEYPIGGSGAMVRGLVDHLERQGVRVILNSRIHRCRINADGSGGTCETAVGEVPFDRVYFSSRAHPKLLLDGQPVNILREHSRLRCVLILLDSPADLDFGYVEVLGDPLIRRVRNVSSFVRPKLLSGRSIVCIQVRESNAVDTELNDLVEEVVQRLRVLRLLSSDDRVVDSVDTPFEYWTIPAAELDRLNESLGGSACGIATTDVAEGLVDLLESPEQSWLPRSS